MDPNPIRSNTGKTRGRSGTYILSPGMMQPSTALLLQYGQPGPNLQQNAPKLLMGSRPKAQIQEEMQQITEGACNLAASGDAIPVSRGLVRGRRTLDIVHFKSETPKSSLGATGKQGTLGQPVTSIANYFPIKSFTNWCLYQYRVDFYPEEDRIGTKRGLLGEHRDCLGAYLFDGTMLFSSRKYDPYNFELTSQRRSDDKIVIIKIKFINIIETGDYANIQVFNLLLRNCMRHLDLKLVGRNFYDSKAKLWPGYETTIGKYEKDILFFAEISTKVMRQETVLDFFNECTAERHRNPDWMTTFKSNIMGITILTIYSNETYKIDDIDENSNPSSFFLKKDGTRISYIQYYKEKWNVTIRVNQQPMLISKNKKLTRRFGEDRFVYLVPELCVMTGFTEKLRNDFTLMRDMSMYTRVNPGEGVKRLTNFANRLSNLETEAELKRWNLTLGNGLVDVPARILGFEQLKSNNKGYDGGIEADWTKHLRALPMYSCAVMKTWVILTPQDFLKDVQVFSQTLSKAAIRMSFKLPTPIIVPMKDGKSKTFVSNIEMVINVRNPNLILCVVPHARGDIYNLIKRKLCIDRAVPSQVVLLENVQKNNLSVCTIQINCKMGNASCHVTIPKKVKYFAYGDFFMIFYAFILVTKRICTRFFTNGKQNPQPGTVIDSVLTDPTKYDFF